MNGLATYNINYVFFTSNSRTHTVISGENIKMEGKQQPSKDFTSENNRVGVKIFI